MTSLPQNQQPKDATQINRNEIYLPSPQHKLITQALKFKQHPKRNDMSHQQAIQHNQQHKYNNKTEDDVSINRYF